MFHWAERGAVTAFLLANQVHKSDLGRNFSILYREVDLVHFKLLNNRKLHNTQIYSLLQETYISDDVIKMKNINVLLSGCL